MKKDDCIFCKLANGDIPTRKIYDDDEFAVFMDASPASKGHALVVPKDHYCCLFEIPEEKAAKAIKIAKKVAEKMKEELNIDGLNIVQNNGEVAGQTVFHFHMHVIPRYKDDDNKGVIKWNQHEFDDATMDELQKKLKF